MGNLGVIELYDEANKENTQKEQFRDYLKYDIDIMDVAEKGIEKARLEILEKKREELRNNSQEPEK